MSTEELCVEDNTQEVKGAMKKAGAFFFLLLLFEIPLSFLLVLVQRFFSEEQETLVSILMTQCYLLVGAVLFLIITKQKPVQDLRLHRYRLSTFFLSLVMLLTASPMASWLNVFSQLFADNTTSGAIFSVTQQVPAWLGILIIGCLPGLVEETIYRGIMLSAFRKRSALTGIVISALSFGLMHLNFNQMLYAVYLGLVFALLVEATGSLVSTMLLHMLFNGANAAYIYILPKFYDWLGQYSPEYADVNLEEVFNEAVTKEQLIPMLILLAPLALGGLVLTWLLLRAIASLNGRSLSWAYLRGNREEVSKTKPVNVWLVLGWIFCLVVSFMNL